jgi:hypothetical protein
MIRPARPAFLLLAICFSLGIFSCANNAVSDSGGGIGVGNPTACIVDSLDRPIANASVKIIASDNWFSNIKSGRSVVVGSVTTDDSGFVFFDSFANGSYNLQVDHFSGGTLVRDFRRADSQEVIVIRIKKYGTIAGAISSNPGEPTQIRLSGTTYSAPIGSDGSYSLLNIPEGLYAPIVMAKDSSWTVAHGINVTSSTTTTSIDEVSFATLVIDDFEDSGSTMKLGLFVKGSTIYTALANNNGTSAQYQIVTEGIKGVNALKGTLIRNGAYALVGFSLGVKPGGDSLWNFSQATGLSFYAKGSGKLNVSFESDSIDKMGYFKHFSADVVLQSQWRQITIPFDSLKFYKDLNPSPDITWQESARSIKRIEFNALEGDTVQFWLDDLLVNGVVFSKAYFSGP